MKNPKIQIIIGVLLLGTGPIFVKTIQASGVTVAFYRMLFAGCMLAVPFWFEQKRMGAIEAAPTNKTNYWLLVLGGCAFGINIALWTTALKYTSAAIVTLLDNTAPIWVGVFSWILWRQQVSGKFWLGALISLVGCALMVGSFFGISGGDQTIGLILSIISGISYAIYILITQKARKGASSLRYSLFVSWIGAVAIAIFGITTGHLDFHLERVDFVLIFLLALSSQVLGWLFVNQALGKIPADAASITLVGQPLVSTVLAAMLLGEVISPIQIAGGLICLVGIGITQRTIA